MFDFGLVHHFKWCTQSAKEVILILSSLRSTRECPFSGNFSPLVCFIRSQVLLFSNSQFIVSFRACFEYEITSDIILAWILDFSMDASLFSPHPASLFQPSKITSLIWELHVCMVIIIWHPSPSNSITFYSASSFPSHHRACAWRQCCSCLAAPWLLPGHRHAVRS